MAFKDLGFGSNTRGANGEEGEVARLQRTVGADPDDSYGLRTLTAVHEFVDFAAPEIARLRVELQQALASGGTVDDTVDAGGADADRSRTPHIVVTNRTDGHTTNAEMRRWVDVAKEFRDRYIAPNWGWFELSFDPRYEHDGVRFEMRIVRRSSVPRAYGHHSFETVNGDTDPYGEVTTEEPGVNPIKTLCHELEMVPDLSVNRVARRTNTISEFMEFGDPRQGDPGPQVRGEETINIVTRNWYDFTADGDFDIMGLATRPFQIGPGGFSIGIDHTTGAFHHRLQDNSLRPAFGGDLPPFIPAHAKAVCEAAQRAVA